MAKIPRITHQTLKVLDAVVVRAGISGAEITRATGLPSGTLYPILLRLESAGWLRSEWELLSAQELGRPRRRFYTLTQQGAAHARSAAEEMKSLIGRLAWT